MIYDILVVAFQTLASVAAAAVLVLGFAFLVFLGDANARDRSLVSKGVDRLAAAVIYLSWFALLWWFGFSTPLLMVACAAALALCLVYAASYRATASRRSPEHQDGVPTRGDEGRVAMKPPFTLPISDR